MSHAGRETCSNGQGVRGKTMRVMFTVYAKPEPQGSTKAFMRKGARFPVVTSDNKNLKSYRQQVAIVALGAMRDAKLEPIERKMPVEMSLRFYLARPASKSKKASPVVKPDLDKLVRGIFDAI